MSLHHGGTFYVPEGETRTVRLPGLREGTDSSRVLLFSNRGEVYVPAYVEEAESDDLLLFNQYSAEAFVQAVKAAVEYGDVDPSEGRWLVHRDETGRLEVDHDRGPEDAADAM